MLDTMVGGQALPPLPPLSLALAPLSCMALFECCEHSLHTKLFRTPELRGCRSWNRDIVGKRSPSYKSDEAAHVDCSFVSVFVYNDDRAEQPMTITKVPAQQMGNKEMEESRH